jgi:hypothetical protein
MPAGTRMVLLLSLGNGVALAVRAAVTRSEGGLCRFDIGELACSERLSLLEAVAVDIAGAGLGPLNPPCPEEFPFENDSQIEGIRWPDLDEPTLEAPPDEPSRHIM